MEVRKSVKCWIQAAWNKVLRAARDVPSVGLSDGGHVVPTEVEYWGCGWFDSSHDLQRGLAVIEEAADELMAAVEALFEVDRSAQA